ncbi:MAG TPA: MFS transporter [Candidatus Methylacidiphilales bacterium]
MRTTTLVADKSPSLAETRPRQTWHVGSLTYTAGGLAVVFCWLLWGDFAWAMRDRVVPPVMQLLFKKFGASDLVSGLIFTSLPAALGMIIGPIVSYKSDRLRTKWGRRIPFLIVPVPFMVLSMVGLAYCPSLGGQLSQWLGSWSPGFNASVVILMGTFWTLFEVCSIVTISVYGALINDVVPQKVGGRFYGLFRAASLIAGILLFFNLKENAETHFTWIFLGVGALYGIGFTLMCLKVKEGEYPPAPVAPGGPRVFAAVKTYFKDGFGHPYYLWYFAATVLANLSILPFNLYSVFYAKSIGMDMTIYWDCLGLTYVFSLVLSYPLGIFADRFHPLRVGISMLAVYAVAMICGGLLVRDSSTFSVALVVHGVLAGCLLTATASLGQRLLPRDKFAEIGSAGGIIGAVSAMLLAPIVGQFLDYTHHEYRYTFFFSASLTLMALGAFFILHGRFMALGGPRNYIAPE